MVATTGVADDIRHHLTVTGAPSPAELARTVLAIIDGDVDGKTWDQLGWGYVGKCGTAACVAGHVAVLVDAEPSDWASLGGGLASVDIQGTAAPQVVTSAQLAQVALGLDDDTATALFDAEATREYVTAALETIAAGADNLIEQIASSAVDRILRLFDDIGEPWDRAQHVDAALMLTAAKLLENTSHLSELAHLSLAEVRDCGRPLRYLEIDGQTIYDETDGIGSRP